MLEPFLTVNNFGTLLETCCGGTDGPTDRRTDMRAYRAAIAAKNLMISENRFFGGFLIVHQFGQNTTLKYLLEDNLHMKEEKSVELS